MLVDSIGMIGVDAKHRERVGNRYTLPYDTEFRRAILFERLFRLPVWYAYRGADADTWHWISALKAFEVGEKHDAKQETYLQIDIAHFVCLRSGEDFGKLYTQRMPGLQQTRQGKLVLR